MIQAQEEFVRWWSETVSVRESLGNNQHRSNADPGSTIKKADAEALTGISQQQVSRWRKRLADPEKYEATEFESAYKKVMAAG